jgi:hypothetical protein
MCVVVVVVTLQAYVRVEFLPSKQERIQTAARAFGDKLTDAWAWEEQCVFDLKTADVVAAAASDDSDDTHAHTPRVRFTLVVDKLIDTVSCAVLWQRPCSGPLTVTMLGAGLTQVVGTCDVPLDAALDAMESPSPEVYLPFTLASSRTYSLKRNFHRSCTRRVSVRVFVCVSAWRQWTPRDSPSAPSPSRCASRRCASRVAVSQPQPPLLLLPLLLLLVVPPVVQTSRRQPKPRVLSSRIARTR